MKCFRGPTAASPARMGWGRRRKERWGKRAAPVRFAIHFFVPFFLNYFLAPVAFLSISWLRFDFFNICFGSGGIFKLFFGSCEFFKKIMIIQCFIYQLFLFNRFLEDIYMRKRGWSFCLVVFGKKHWFKNQSEDKCYIMFFSRRGLHLPHKEPDSSGISRRISWWSIIHHLRYIFFSMIISIFCCLYLTLTTKETALSDLYLALSTCNMFY